MRTIEPLATGRFKVRFRLAGKQTSETFDKHADAEDFAKALDLLGPQGALDRLYEGEQDKAMPTMDELAADHIKHLTNTEPGTRRKYERMWAKVWSPHIGKVRVHRLTGDHLSLAVADLGARYSHKSMENQRGLLAAVLARGIEKEHITRNPAKGLRLPAGQPSRGGKDGMRILSVDEFLQIEAALDEHYRPLIRFMWGTGARWGEAVALTVGAVDLPNVRIVQAAKYTGTNETRIGPPKTKRSTRTIALPAELHDDMRALTKGRGRDEFVFTNRRGEMIRHATFYASTWLKAVTTVDGVRPRLHDLRHSHASHLLAAGIPIHIVQARLGHESIEVTVGTYGHLLPDAQRLASEAASLAFTAREIAPAVRTIAATPGSVEA